VGNDTLFSKGWLDGRDSLILILVNFWGYSGLYIFNLQKKITLV